MKQIKYMIETCSPILISADSGNPFATSTKDYIPGINILGALAAKYLKQQGLNKYFTQVKPTDKNFLDWFVNGSTTFSNAYIQESENSSLPIPVSVQYLKNNEKLIYDLLYSEPDEQTKPIGGYCIINENVIQKVKVLKNYSPHHKRDYETGAAESGIFFNYESISYNQSFVGTISGDDRLIEDFYKYFSTLKELRIGRSKTAEYGRINITFNMPENLIMEVDDFDSNEEISLTFLSDIIIYNKYGSATSCFQDLEKYLKDNISQNIEIKKTSLKVSEVENFVSVWKLKKPSEVSFLAGSCLLLKVDKKDFPKLKELQITGIGERRNEGYGKIIFGMQKFGNYEQKQIIHSRPQKPTNGNIPDKVEYITKKIAIEYLQKITAIEALKIVKETDEIRKKVNKKIEISSSQVGKLESIVRMSGSEVGFKKTINTSLRKTSIDKLTACHFAGSNLFVFLTNNIVVDNESIKIGIGKIQKLFEDVGIKESEVNNITRQLYIDYYLTLFSALRKAIKGGKKR